MKHHDKSAKHPQSSHDAFVSLILSKMKDGNTKAEILEELTATADSSTDPSVIASAVDKIYNDIVRESLSERFLMGAYFPSVVGGMLAAVIAGFIWGLIIKYTDYEIGLIGIAVGWLCAWSVLLFNNGKKGLPTQIISCGCAICGILIGKYWIFYYLLRNHLTEQYGYNFASRFPLVSMDTLRGFLGFMQESLRGDSIMFQLLWISLALGSAWKMTKATKLSKRVFEEADMEYDAFAEPSFMRSIGLTAVGVMIIYGLFLQLSHSPELKMEDITQDDLKLVTSILHSSVDAEVYFKILDQEVIEGIESDVYMLIESDKDKHDFLEEFQRVQKKYSEGAITLAEREVPDDFEENVSSYPDLASAVYQFILQEYRLNYYYKFYTVFFDADYQLVFDEDTTKSCESIIDSFLAK